MGIRNTSKSKKLGDLLVEVGLLTPQQLKEAVDVQRLKGGALGDILVDLKMMGREVLLSFLGKRCGVSYVSLTEYGAPAPEALALIPAAVARRELLIPLRKRDNELTVAMADPLNVFATDDIRILSGCEIKVLVAAVGEIRIAIDKYYGDVFEMPSVEGQVRFEDAAGTESTPSLEGRDTRAVNLLNVLLDNAARGGATAVHLEPGENLIRVRYRMGGKLVQRPDISGKFQEGLAMRVKELAHMNPLETWAPQEGHIRAKITGRELDIRVSTLPTFYGEQIVLRILDNAAPALELETLGFDERDLQSLTAALKEPQGLVLISGPSGAGKTATFYAALLHLSDAERHVATMEDPVERCLPGLTQVQARPHVGLTLGSGVRSLLRQDADVIGVGQIRRQEEAIAALDAAQAGVTVVATVKAASPVAAVQRILESGASHDALAASLAAVVAQRWAPRLCAACREPHPLSRPVLTDMGLPDEVLRNVPGTAQFYRPKGCGQCGKTGFHGRVLLAAVWRPDERARQEIREGRVGQLPGGDVLRAAGFRKAMEGAISLDEALR